MLHRMKHVKDKAISTHVRFKEETIGKKIIIYTHTYASLMKIGYKNKQCQDTADGGVVVAMQCIY